MGASQPLQGQGNSAREAHEPSIPSRPPFEEADRLEEDQRMLAYELHDGVAQELQAALMQFLASRDLRAVDAGKADEAFEAGLRLLGKAIQGIRRLIRRLEPPVLEQFGIVKALETLIAEGEETAGRQIDLVCDVTFTRLAPPLENAVFRIVQESLANACRHTQSPRIRVELSQEQETLKIEVRDWGAGFDPANVGRYCFGLRSIRHRAALVGGSAEIRSVLGEGTRVIARLPLVESPARPTKTPEPPPRPAQ